ncbi:MAG TPA: hypothetical protein VMM76_05710 [Pirellulaceae bacterium]|nr:hypothetical protein [Pirellulaceae bacterium]
MKFWFTTKRQSRCVPAHLGVKLLDIRCVAAKEQVAQNRPHDMDARRAAAADSNSDQTIVRFDLYDDLPELRSPVAGGTRSWRLGRSDVHDAHEFCVCRRMIGWYGKTILGSVVVVS